MNHKQIATAAVLAGLLAMPRAAGGHCQVPCGIYDDHARVQMIREDIVTITKAVGEIRTLSKKRDPQSMNQLTRWVVNKEHHAERIIRTISDYFLTQKIKPTDPRDRAGYTKYLEMLARHHAVMVAAMKCKQSASPDAVKALGRVVDAIAGYWPAHK
jgi:nickel superoxide dismutase